MNPEDLAAYIRKNVIYADKKIVVINKPYGIAIHGKFFVCFNG